MYKQAQNVWFFFFFAFVCCRNAAWEVPISARISVAQVWSINTISYAAGSISSAPHASVTPTCPDPDFCFNSEPVLVWKIMLRGVCARAVPVRPVAQISPLCRKTLKTNAADRKTSSVAIASSSLVWNQRRALFRGAKTSLFRFPGLEVSHATRPLPTAMGDPHKQPMVVIIGWLGADLKNLRKYVGWYNERGPRFCRDLSTFYYTNILP